MTLHRRLIRRVRLRRRVVPPGLTGHVWTSACSCGWEGKACGYRTKRGATGAFQLHRYHAQVKEAA